MFYENPKDKVLRFMLIWLLMKAIVKSILYGVHCEYDSDSEVVLFSLHVKIVR